MFEFRNILFFAVVASFGAFYRVFPLTVDMKLFITSKRVLLPSAMCLHLLTLVIVLLVAYEANIFQLSL